MAFRSLLRAGHPQGSGEQPRHLSTAQPPEGPQPPKTMSALTSVGNENPALPQSECCPAGKDSGAGAGPGVDSVAGPCRTPEATSPRRRPRLQRRPSTVFLKPHMLSQHCVFLFLLFIFFRC